MIQYSVANGLFDQAAQELAELYSDGDRLRQSIQQHPNSDIARAYQHARGDIQQAETVIHDLFTEMLLAVPEELSRYSVRDLVARNKLARQQLITALSKHVPQASALIGRLQWIESYASAILSSLKTLRDRMNEAQQYTLPLDSDTAQRLARGLHPGLKAQLIENLQQLACQLDDGDVFFYAIQAFIRLMKSPSSSEAQLASDRRVLNAFQNIRDVYPKMARHLCRSLERYLKEGGSYAELSLYGPYGGSHQRMLIRQLSEGRLAVLRQALILRLQRCLQERTTDIDEGHKLWKAHGQLAMLLCDLGGESAAAFRTKLKKIVRKAESRFMRTVLPLSEGGFPIDAIDPLLEVSQEFMSYALAARHLGDPRTRVRLSEVMDLLMAKLRKAMMSLVTDAETEKFIDFARQMIDAGGTQRHREEIQALIHIWQLYCCDLANLLVLGLNHSPETEEHATAVRREAIGHAVCDYVEQLDERLMRYFQDRFELRPSFQAKFTSLREAFMSVEEGTPTQFHIDNLLDLLRQEQVKSHWLWNIPRRRDAIQLEVAIKISTLAHKWLEEQQTQPPADCVPMALCDQLKSSAANLVQVAHIGHGKFTCELATAIGRANQYFIHLPETSAAIELGSRAMRDIPGMGFMRGGSSELPA